VVVIFYLLSLRRQESIFTRRFSQHYYTAALLDVFIKQLYLPAQRPSLNCSLLLRRPPLFIILSFDGGLKSSNVDVVYSKCFGSIELCSLALLLFDLMIQRRSLPRSQPAPLWRVDNDVARASNQVRTIVACYSIDWTMVSYWTKV